MIRAGITGVLGSSKTTLSRAVAAALWRFSSQEILSRYGLRILKKEFLYASIFYKLL
jgi:type II secretory pathway predicted ATPase ExeA